MKIKRKLFFLFSIMLFLSSYNWIKDAAEPGWKKYQEEYYKGQRKDVEKKLQNEKNIEETEKLKEKLAKLRNPSYEIKQILLKGEYSWANQRNGQKVDRCMTCHIDEGKLKESHITVVKDFPFDIYGCTVCHGGVGRMLDEEHAHHDMYKHKRQMHKRMTNSDAIFAMWEELATLSLDDEVEWGSFKNRTITGEKAIYLGSGRCLRCHTGLTAPHVERWKRVKFESFRVVQEAPDFIDGDKDYRKMCYECHTTGYDKETGTYSEEGITCEACHGPGEVFAYFMDVGKALEGQKIARITPAYNVCGSNTGCHRSRRHEMRVKYFREHKKYDPYEWFNPKYKRIVDESLEMIKQGK
ncbi:MAG: multiheme c-type cytochrome [Candidatus Scalinduaceae bacterium]